jgi:microtubule-associated protein-like 6
VRIAGAGGTLDAVKWMPGHIPVCATLGSDGWVRLCDAERRAQIAAKNVGAGAAGRSLAFSGDGKLLAAGFADGRVAVLRARTLEFVAETTPVKRERHRREREPGWSESAPDGFARVESLAFSPDSALLAAAGADRVVRVFANVAGAFALVATCAGHSATVRALDWSEDGALLRSQCVGGELLHWRAPEGAKTPKTQTLRPFPGDARDVTWKTHNSTVGFPVMGVWEPGRASNARVVGAIDRSPDFKFVVAGDDAGDLRVLNYPCVVRAAPGAKERAHGARVGGVAFSGDGAWVASVGTADKTLVIWKARERTP